MKNITQEQNEELQLNIIKEFGKDCKLDGILNLEEYNKAPYKILWILKEANWGKEFIGITDGGKKATDEEASKLFKKKIEEMEAFYNNVAKWYRRWRVTYENLCYIIHGVFENVNEYDNMVKIDRNARINGKYYINKIAFINLKKVPGGNKAIVKLIYESYRNHKDFILNQIETINPDIIINCSGISQLTTDLVEGSAINETLNFVKYNNRIIINAYHPAYPYLPYNRKKLSSKQYVDRILNIVQHNYL